MLKKNLIKLKEDYCALVDYYYEQLCEICNNINEVYKKINDLEIQIIHYREEEKNDN